MGGRFQGATAVLLALLLEPRAGGVLPSPGRESEQDLVSHVERERNPVKKAKYEIRLARLKLLQAINAYSQGNVQGGQELLQAYRARVRNSWETLRASGRKAVRQPQGFRELEIALREERRFLEDLERHVSYADRDAVKQARREVDDIRNEVIRALFPRDKLKGSEG